MKTIVTLTMNPAVEMFLEVPRVVPDRKLLCPSPLWTPGGGGVNVSRAIRRLGGTSTALFPAGGSSGDRLIALLQREDIKVDVIRVGVPTRQNVNVSERATGHEYRFIVPGAALTHDEWGHCLQALRSIAPRPDIVVASGSLPSSVPVDFYGRIAAMARELGFMLLVDASGEPLRAAATTGTFLLKPNVGELAAISGGVVTEGVIEGAARSIVSTGRAGVVVVSTGAGGAILVDSQGVRRFAAPLVAVASRVGAGDSMVAGIALSLARGWDIDDAVRYGVAAGSAAVTRPGHQLCRREDTEALFAEVHPSVQAVAV